MDKLKPCPFCGSTATMRGGGDRASWIICDNKKCSATQGLEFTGENAVQMWNTRPAEDALKAENERLKEALTQIGIVMLFSDDENADKIFKLCEENVGFALKNAYVEKLQEDVEKIGIIPDTAKGGEDE